MFNPQNAIFTATNEFCLSIETFNCLIWLSLMSGINLGDSEPQKSTLENY